MNNESMKLNRNSFGSPENKDNVLSEKEAFELLNRWVDNEKLIVHMRQVGHLMKAYASSKGYSEEVQHKWYLAGLLHDADWEKWPELHC